MKVGLLRPSRTAELGDAAILQALTAAAERHRSGSTVVGIPPRDGELSRRVRGPISALGRARRIAGAARQVDLLLIPFGTGLDDTRDGRRNIPASLVPWVVAARLAGTPVALVGLGSGRLGSLPHSRWLKVVLTLATYRSYRDLPSRTSVATETGIGHDDAVVPDIAFSVPVAAWQVRATRTARHAPTVAVEATWDLGGPGRERSACRSSVDCLATSAAALARRGYGVEIFPGARFERPAVDELAAATLELVPAGLRDRVAVPPMESLDELLGVLAKADFVIASTFHGALLAQLLGRPTLALSHDQDVTRLMRDIGVGEHCLDAGRTGPGEVVSAFDLLERRRSEVQERLAAYLAVCGVLVERQYETIFSLRAHRPWFVQGRRPRRLA